MHVNTTEKPVVAVAGCPDYEPARVAASVERAVGALQGAVSALIAPGATVLLNPNLLSPSEPAAAVTTHPCLVACMARWCFDNGAGRVWIGDSCAGDHADQRLWETTGMTAVAAETGAELVSFKGPVARRPCGDAQIPVPAWLDDVDVHVSLPKFKTHTLTGLTCAMKNTFGLVVGRAKSLYHAQYPSPQSMSRFLFEVYRSLRPDLVVVDAVLAMEGEGPASGRPRHAGLIVAGTNAVAVDVVCAGMIRGHRRHIPMLEIAGRCGCPGSRLEDIEMVGDGLEQLRRVSLAPSAGRWLQAIPEPVFQLATRLLACRPKVLRDQCVACGVCARICSQNAIHADGDAYTIEAARCIMCMCCAESCPQHAIVVRSPLRLFSAVRTLVHRAVRVPAGKKR